MDLLPVPPLDELRRRGSAKWRMHPADVLPMSIAEMDFGLAAPIAAALHAAVDRDDLGYADGFAELADAYAAFADATWGWAPATEHIRPVTDVGVGAVELLRALGVRRVVISSPVYPPFADWVGESGAELVDAPLHGGRLDLDRLDSALGAGGAYLLCNPHNPTGTVHTAAELSALVEMAHAYGVTVLSDEIHAPLALSGAEVTPILTVPGAAEVAIALTSASKTWNLAGLKCALMIAEAPLAPTLDRLPPDSRWRVGILGVAGSVAAFRDGEPWRQRLLSTLDDRRSHFAALAAEHLPELRHTPGAATYLAWLSYDGSGTDLAAAILEHGRVAVEPGERFGAGGAGHIRINLATSRDLIEQAVAGVRAGLDSLAS
jgi:cysteine-S-conjugate beta-lyase